MFIYFNQRSEKYSGLKGVCKTGFADLNTILIFSHRTLQAVRRKTSFCYMEKILFEVKTKIFVLRHVNCGALLILLEMQVTEYQVKQTIQTNICIYEYVYVCVCVCLYSKGTNRINLSCKVL